MSSDARPSSPVATSTHDAADDDAMIAIDRFACFLSQMEGASPQTVRAYRGHLDAYASWARRTDRDALHVSVQDLRRYLAELKMARYAPRTVASHLSAIRSFFRWALAEELVDTDVASTIQTPKTPGSLPSTVSHEEMKRLLEAPDLTCDDGIRDRAMLELFYATGARISELAGLRLNSFAPAERTVRLLGKGSKERIVPVYRRAWSALEEYLDGPRGRLLAAAGDAASTQAQSLFISRRGKPMNADALRYRFRVLARKAGLPSDITPHTMRHTFATDLLQGGADLRSVQELLGHASLSTTQLYTHLTPERLKNAVHQAHPRG